MPTWLENAIDGLARTWARVSVPSYWCQQISEFWGWVTDLLARAAKRTKSWAFTWAKRARRFMEDGR